MARPDTDTSNSSPPAEQALPFARLESALAALLESGDGGAIDMVDTTLTQAALHRASDVHIEPWEDCVAVRFRIDGILHEVARFPREHHVKVVGRVKVLGRIITYQKDLPQDGRIDPENTPCGKAMRVSTFPTVYGEKIVIRLLDTDPGLFSVDALGFKPDVVSALRSIVARPQGTLLLTGPASSGKTTTIYALLKGILEMRAPSPHVVTIEDPVEYRLGRVAQTQINPHAGFTFAAALRAVLRQDPEVIMLGEIRDTETASAAIQAGLTGHLVISTIHSGTAAGVFTRLLDMGIEPFLIASSVTGVLAQRLVRVSCPHCVAEYSPDPADRVRFGLADPDIVFRRGEGCAACQEIGYLGRSAVGELLLMDEAISDLILARPRTHTIHEAALEAGMRPLAQDATLRVCEGTTTVEELKRAMPAPHKPVSSPVPQSPEAVLQSPSTVGPVASCSEGDTAGVGDTASAEMPGGAVQSARRNGGWSLVELMTALFVLSLGLMGVIQTYHFGLDKIRTMRESGIATRIVQNEVETLRALPFSALDDRKNAPFISPAPGLERLVNGTPALTIRPHPDPALRLKEATVSLRWSGDNGRTMERSATTLIADKGMAKRAARGTAEIAGDFDWQTGSPAVQEAEEQ